MKSKLTTLAVALVVVAATSTSAMAGKSTTPNPVSPPSVTATTIGAFGISPIASGQTAPLIGGGTSGGQFTSSWMQGYIGSFSGLGGSRRRNLDG